MLRRDSHMVDAVTTGEEAVQSLRNAPYDMCSSIRAARHDHRAGGRDVREMRARRALVPLVVLGAAARRGRGARLARHRRG